MSHRRSRWAMLSRALVPGAVLTLVVLHGFTPAASQERGRCAVTELPGHLVLPDGVIHDGGELKICFDGWHNPSVGRHVIYLNRKPWGYLLSRSGTNQGAGARVPILVFTPRTKFDHVRLLGYVWPDQNRMIAHVLHVPGQKMRKSHEDPSEFLESANRENYVLVAARIE